MIGRYRRYVVTKVLDHWMVRKPAYRVTLENGTELITSGDHRLLSNRGWKYVTGAEQGPLQRPHLTVNNKLVGTGAFAEPPRATRRLQARIPVRDDPRRRTRSARVSTAAERAAQDEHTASGSP